MARVWLIDDPHLSSPARFLLMALADQCREGKSTCSPGIDLLAKMTHTDEKTVRRHLRELTLAGYIQPIVKGGRKPAKNTKWQVNLL